MFHSYVYVYGLGGDYINKGVEAIGIKEAKGKLSKSQHKVSSKAYKVQLGTLKRNNLDSPIVLDFYRSRIKGS